MVIIGIIVCLLTIPLFSNSYSELDRADIDEIKEKITDANVKITTLDDEIDEQKSTITQNESHFDDLKSELNVLKKIDDDSWDYIQKIMDAQSDISDAEKEITLSKDELSLLYTKRSDTIKLISQLEDELESVFIILKKQVSEEELLQNTNDNLNFTNYVKKIGIVLSPTCLTMIKNNITTTCPTYEELYHLDSSIQNISGEFGFEDGFFQRLNPELINSWRWYDFDNNIRIFLDPPSGMESRMKMIEIQPNLKTFDIGGKKIQLQKFEDKEIEITNIFNKTSTITIKVETQKEGRILYHDRYIDDYCKRAIINADKWAELLSDTILHMQQNCEDGTTSFDNMEFIPAKKT